eukprot:3177782-Pyramimonas_sp.AAC.1
MDHGLARASVNVLERTDKRKHEYHNLLGRGQGQGGKNIVRSDGMFHDAGGHGARRPGLGPGSPGPGRPPGPDGRPWPPDH